MGLHLHPWVGEMAHYHVEPHFYANMLHTPGQLVDREQLGKLVEYPVFAWGRGIVQRELDTLQSVDNVEKTSCLLALPINGQGPAHCGLHAKTVKHGAKHFVIVDGGSQPYWIEGDFFCEAAKDDTLVEICRPKTGYLAGKADVIAIVYFAQMVEWTW